MRTAEQTWTISRRFNQIVYVHKNHDPDLPAPYIPHPQPGGCEYSPVAAKAPEGRVRPARAAKTARIEDPKIGGRHTRTVILYVGLKRIDIVNDLRAVRTAMKTLTATTWFYAFLVISAPCEQVVTLKRTEQPGRGWIRAAG